MFDPGPAAELLASLGMACEGETALTPARFTRALAELTRGLREPFDPAPLFARTFAPPGPFPQIIVMRGIAFTSVCEHHLLPFHGSAVVGYLPADGAQLAGASKLARLVEGFAGVPQMQERLGQQVVDALGNHLTIQGAGCILTATHTCLTLRGARNGEAQMVTSHLTGEFLDAPVRGEFLTLASHR